MFLRAPIKIGNRKKDTTKLSGIHCCMAPLTGLTDRWCFGKGFSTIGAIICTMATEIFRLMGQVAKFRFWTEFRNFVKN